MPKYKVTATQDVGWELIVSAENEDEAWRLAYDDDALQLGWVQTDNGHDWTIESVNETDRDPRPAVQDEWPIVVESDGRIYGRFNRRHYAWMLAKALENAGVEVNVYGLEGKDNG